jgi:hypothetical protein
MLQHEPPSGIRSGGVTEHAGGRPSQPRGKPTATVVRRPVPRPDSAITIPQMSDPPIDPAAFEQFLAAGRLPQWLPLVLTTLSDGYQAADPGAAARWRRRIVDSVRQVPFTAVHDWQAGTVVPMMAAADHPDAGHLRQLHAQAAAGERFGEAEWRAAIEPVLRELYRQAYGYAEAYATAHASASAYASANNFSPDGAVRFADSYAADSTEANRQSYAESNAVANAAMLAAAYASGDARAYAEAYPFALLNACAHAAGNQPAAGPAENSAPTSDADRAARRLAGYARLAEGLADGLAR